MLRGLQASLPRGDPLVVRYLLHAATRRAWEPPSVVRLAAVRLVGRFQIEVGSAIEP